MTDTTPKTDGDRDTPEYREVEEERGFVDRLLHAEFESDGELVLFECRECGYTTLSIGGLHGHCERHRGYTRFNIGIPFTKTGPGNFEELMKLTKILRVEETSEITREEVEGL